MNKRVGVCKNCSGRIVRLFHKGWIHSDSGWRLFACPIQQAINYRPRAEPKESE